MRINRPAIWLGAVLVVLAVSIPTGYVLLANEADATADHYADRGAAMGEAFVEGSESVALRITDILSQWQSSWRFGQRNPSAWNE